MKATILAISSSGGSYNVDFEVHDGGVAVRCSCAAGEIGQVCKHKLGMIKGVAATLFNPAQLPELEAVRAWTQFASLRSRIERYEKELAALEVEKAAVSKKEKSTKAQMARELSTGIYS